MIGLVIGIILIGVWWIYSSYDEEKQQEDKSLIIPIEWKICEENSDCIETQPDCCGCTGGGRQIAINKKFISRWKENIKNACWNIGCIAAFTCKPGHPACVNKLCNYIEVSEEDCIKENKSYQITDQPYVCCSGLKAISCDVPDEQGKCQKECIETIYCTACGNGICKEPENICNCPEDCLSKIPNCKGLQGEVREKCECVALNGWWDNNKCYPLTSDVGKLCTDSNECEGECVGAGWEATSGKCSKWTVEKGCHYVLINGKVNFAIGCE